MEHTNCGWSNGERALLPGMWPGFSSQTWHHTLYVSGLSLLTLYSALKGLSPGTPVFPLPKKQHLKWYYDQIFTPRFF